jgi:hypothetical protein
LWAGESALSSLITALGFMPNVGTVWEKVPFSFVLDWVFNTKQLFKRLSLFELGYDLETEIIDFCLVHRSVKRSTWDYSDLQMGYTNTAAVDETDVCARYCGSEAWSKLSWWIRLPSFMQLALGASLVRLRLNDLGSLLNKLKRL